MYIEFDLILTGQVSDCWRAPDMAGKRALQRGRYLPNTRHAARTIKYPNFVPYTV